MKLKLTILLLLILAKISYSQNITILDSETKLALNNVLVYNDNQTKFVISNKNGIVNLDKFNDDEEVLIEHVSYQFVFFKKKDLIKKGDILYLVKTNDLLPEVVLSVSNNKIKLSRISKHISVITSNDILEINPQSTPDLLSSTPGITVQKSQLGGGSPTIRGFEANRVLLVVDGIRMNNAIYRSGHLQNSLTIDACNLERTEIIYGPTSTKYGSDALGGVIHFYTKRPKLGKEFWQSNARSRFSTADNGLSLHADAIYNNDKFGSFSSISYGNFGDLTMGKIRTHGFEDWGKVYKYSSNTEHFYTDTETDNQNPDVQKNTSYSQLDLLQKLIFKIDKKNELELNLQYSTSSDVPRFDALTDLKKGKLKWAEWYYGPQNRFLISSKLLSSIDKKWMKESNITLAYQNIKESRIQRKYGSIVKTFRNENVNVFSLNADFNTDINNYEISYGSEITFNKVNSSARGDSLLISGNKIIGTINNVPVQSRYPDGGSDYSSLAFYIDTRRNITTKTIINAGIRFTSTLMHAKWDDNTYVTLANNNITLLNNAINGNIGYVYKPNNKWILKAHISSAFRSPNIDDVGKIREKNNLMTVPNTNLKPEYAVNTEINISHNLLKNNLILSTDFFYTRIFDYIMRNPYQLTPGVDSLIYDGTMTKTIANVNSGQAYIYGINFGVLAKINKQLTLKSFLTYTKGRTIDQSLPMASIPPLFGSTALKFKHKHWLIALNSVYNARKKAEDFDVYGGVDNLDKAASESYGTPSWYTLNTSITYIINHNFNIRIDVDNILDHHYMSFASGISAPGRNFIFTINAEI